MSISTIQSNIERYQREVTDIIKQIGEKRKKLADAKTKGLKAQTDATKSKSQSTIKSKLNEIKRYATEEAKLTKEIAILEKKQANTQKKLDSERNKLNKEQAKEDKKKDAKIAADQKATEQAMSNLDKRVKTVQDEQKRLHSALYPLLRVEESESYDVFISHASEDKATFVDEFVQELINLNVKVWYDKLNIGWGQSLRVSIETGLLQSKNAIVVISPSYFQKYWTGQELNGIFTKESAIGNCILPIWHNITKDEVAQRSPILADRLALDTSIMSSKEIAEQFVNILNRR